MANSIRNDRGQWVPATGAPHSLARLIAEYPALIESLAAEESALANAGRPARLHAAHSLMRKAGITDPGTMRTLRAAARGEEP